MAGDDPSSSTSTEETNHVRPTKNRQTRAPWNKGTLTGPKSLLKVREIWAIRIRLQRANKLRDLALFNLAIDSKLRGCDLVALRVRDVAHGGTVAHRAIVLQHKTQQPACDCYGANQFSRCSPGTRESSRTRKDVRVEHFSYYVSRNIMFT